ncbi:MAG TPA: YbaK/EbsC family protein [Anaerolineales bacterium]|nr:YbaK/EbsC family protein [Anaerolineales bacterium]
MKYRDLQIQTQREAPNNARTEGFAFLVRAGYLTRENVLTKLGEYAINHLRETANESLRLLPTIGNERESFFSIPTGDIEIAHCANCKYTERIEFARFAKSIETSHAAPLPLEKVETPYCNTIESLANFLNISKEQTAKALMYTRVSDNKFVFVVVRGDMQLSEAKLKAQVGDVRAARAEEIVSVGAVAGYASAVGLALSRVEGLRDALIVVDDLIPQSPNLVAGANEAGFHLKNTNYGRDYSAEIVADLVQAQGGDACVNCGNPLSVLSAIRLNDNFENILLALAETHHDEKGLTLPHPAAPFDVYLMHIPGKELDTRAKAEEIYNSLKEASFSVLFDDRDERAGVKFNDADLIGCPIRVTVGEKGLKANAVEVKSRRSADNLSVELSQMAAAIKNML